MIACKLLLYKPIWMYIYYVPCMDITPIKEILTLTLTLTLTITLTLTGPPYFIPKSEIFLII